MGISALLAYRRRALVGGTELALYWLGCVLAMAIVTYEWMLNSMILWWFEWFGFGVRSRFESLTDERRVKDGSSRWNEAWYRIDIER